MKNRLIRSIPVVILVGIAACLSSCVEQPTIVEEGQLAFLENQSRPLFIGDVIKGLGGTEIGRDGPYYEYAIGNTKESVQFWMYPPRKLASNGQPLDTPPVEIAMVIKTTKNEKNAKPRVVWPRDLEQAEIEVIWKDIWRKSGENPNGR